MKKRTVYLAFDLGASNGRAILGILENKKLILEEIHRFETYLIEDGEHLKWDLGKIWSQLQLGLKKALDTHPDIKSISVTSWAVDYVPVTEEGDPVRYAYCYRDSRVSGMMDKVFQKVSPEEIYSVTGIQFMEINSLYQLFTDTLEEPGLIEETDGYLMISEFFNYLFSGKRVNEISQASTTQFMDIRKGAWSGELAEKLNLPLDKWAEIVPSGTKLGPAKLNPSIEVVAGLSHDTACAVAAVPAQNFNRWAYISCGTWSLVGAELNEPILSDEARMAGFTNETGIDSTIRFLKNRTGLWVLQECEREWKEDGDIYTYAELLEEAREVDIEIPIIDLNDQRFAFRGNMQKKISDYCREHKLFVPVTRGEFTAVIMHSLADSYNQTIKELETLLEHKIDTIHLVGGGSRNEWLCQLTADYTGCEVVAGPVEATAIGNLLVQARAMGDINKHSDIRDIVKKSFQLKHYHPVHSL